MLFEITFSCKKRSRLSNRFFKAKFETDRQNYNKQHNFCLSLIRSEKKNYFSNINIRSITDFEKKYFLSFNVDFAKGIMPKIAC